MNEVEKIKRYIARTNIDPHTRLVYSMSVGEAIAINQMPEEYFVDRVNLAFKYGMARGYRAAKAEQSK